MGFLVRRFVTACISATLFVFAFRQLTLGDSPSFPNDADQAKRPVKWKHLPQRYPVSSMIALPSGTPSPIPRIQHQFGVETQHSKEERLQRQAAVKEAFIHSWEGYKKHAWAQDEIRPVSGGHKSTFGNRGATLVDSLDTLLILGLEKEFDMALKVVKKIDFSTSDDAILNVFETNIRYLGGLLSAYDLSGGKHRVLLDKAVQLGDMLYGAFDTPNRLPVTRWDWERGSLKVDQKALSSSFSAEVGTLSLEFTRLSQLTGDPKYYDAVERISKEFTKHQNETAIPGLFPITISPADSHFSAYNDFSFGGCSDSLYEYFSKEYMLLGGLVDHYRVLHEGAINAAKQHLFFRPLNPQNQDILISGNARKSALGMIKLEPEAQHLSCFVGGMVAIGARIFSRADDLDVARKLVNGCIWAYESMPSGMMPEKFSLIPCKDPKDCPWDSEHWHAGVWRESGIGRDLELPDVIREDRLQPGFTSIEDRRFLLRPEAIESIFILYRITGDVTLQETAWRMFTAIDSATKTEFAHSAIADVTRPKDEETKKLDECESFWMAETLKYFYLIFSDPGLVSLDEYVFNTEAHPLRRPLVK